MELGCKLKKIKCSYDVVIFMPRALTQSCSLLILFSRALVIHRLKVYGDNGSLRVVTISRNTSYTAKPSTSLMSPAVCMSKFIFSMKHWTDKDSIGHSFIGSSFRSFRRNLMILCSGGTAIVSVPNLKNLCHLAMFLLMLSNTLKNLMVLIVVSQFPKKLSISCGGFLRRIVTKLGQSAFNGLLQISTIWQ